MTLPDKLTAAEFERLKAQEQRMLDSGSWVPQAEDRLTSQVNAAAAESAAPDSMTAEQADVAEAQQSVMAETQFGRSVGIRPDYSQPPAKDPSEDEPKTINDLRKRQQDLYNDPSYDMPFEEWQDFTRWQKQNESEVGSFIGGLPGMAQSLGQLGVGLVKERAHQAYRATAGLDPIGAAATEVATFKEMGRKIGVGLTQLSDWVGGKVNDIVESGRRVGQVQQNVIRALRDSGQLTGDPIQDNTTIQKALEEAAAQGMYEPTQQQAEEDEEVGYQRYQRKKAYDREYAGITEFSIGGNRMTLPNVKETVTMPTLLPNTEQSKGVNVERQVFQPQEATSTVGAMAFSPENALPIGVGVLARARMLRRLASVTGTPLRATETAMASVDDWLARTADRVTSKVPFVGDLPLNQRAYALGAAGGVGAYLDATTDSPVIDVIAKPLIVAGLVLPAAKAAGGTIRRVGAGAGAGWQVIKEMDAGAVGSARAETAARMAASGKFNPRYSKYMERGAQGGVESTLRRVSQNPDMPETLRRVARSADNIGITQLARGIDDAVSSSVAAGVAATPFALVAPDSETAGGIVGGALLLGGTLGTAGRVIGRRSARTDADIARMMVDVEMAGGDAGSLGALSYSGLDLLAAMQGVTSGKVDFVPLRAQEYRANADVRASGGETVAGLHIEKAADGRAKVYVNMGHTAPIAGRVSIKPIQITRNGKTEDANVVRIKGEDGQSDFTVVPREYPLLVKSGDFVEPNARLARGLSPTHVMPHEIGHAILTSSILNGSIRDDLRNLVNQRYDTAGVEARGREYVTRIVDKDILAGAHDQLPDKLTQQEFDEISSGRRTMADVLKGKPVSDAQREQMITDRYNEMRERSIAEGNNPDGLDVFRDEIVAETFSSLSDSLDFRRMRAGGPQVMESVLAATARVFETMGVKFDRSTGKLMDNPSVVFRDNPLMQDPIMRKRMQEHLRNYEAWMLGMEQAGAREQKGTQISVDGSAESARRSTHTKLRANDNGVLENDLIYIDQNGQAQWKPQKMLDEQEKGRSAQVGQLYDKNKILPPNSAEFGLRRAGVGRTVISGPTLPAKFDVLRWFPKHIREMARMLEAGREGGASHIFDYNTIGTGEGGRYRVINRGDVRAIIREGAFLGWEATKNGHLKAVVMDLNAFRSAAMRAINRGELGIFNNDMSQLQADLMVYLANHKNGLPGEATIGQQKRDMLNGLIGTGTAVQRDINPLYADLNPRGSVRSFRFDRINDITPTGRDGYHFDYDKIKNNRMPSALPQAGMAMPEVAVRGERADIPLNPRARQAAFISDRGEVRSTGRATHFETNEDLGPDFLAIGAGHLGEDGFFRFGSQTMDDAMGESPATSAAAAARFNQSLYDQGRRPSAMLEEPPGLERTSGRGQTGQAMPDITITPEEARRRGLVGPVYHGSPDFKGRKFDPKYRARSSGLSRGGFSFSDDVASADGYASAPIDSAQAAVDSANDVMREAAGRMERGLKIKGFSAPDELPEFNVRYVDDISELSSYFNELAKDMPKDLATRLRDAAKQVNEPANPVVVEAYLRNPKTMDINGKKLWLVENPDDIFVSAARPPRSAATGRTSGQAMPDVGSFDESVGGFVVDAGDDVSLPVHQQAVRGKPALDATGKPKYIQLGYDLLDAPGIKEYAGPGPEDTTKPDYKALAYDTTLKGQKQINDAIDSGAVDNAANRIVSLTQEAMKNPEIAAGMGWYSRMRKYLLGALGEEGRELLSQLLGATSAKTPVEQNFLQAMDALEGIRAGRYEGNRKSYLEMLAAEEGNNLTALIVERGYVSQVRKMADDLSKLSRSLKGEKKKAALAEAAKLRTLAKTPASKWTKKDRFSIMINATGMVPLRSNGKKFNANSMAVLKVIAGTWLDNRNSPKTPNFAGNLSGRTVQATIDVWAARLLRETLYEGSNKPWRIQPRSETGVNNQDFALGQIIMQRAAKKLDMNPDDLQAVLWFAEKHRWDERGWTKNQGAEKSSFDEVFKVFFPKGKKPLTFAEASKIFEEKE